MSERIKQITENVKVYDCDVCKKEAEHSMLCHACHRDFCEEHQEGGGTVSNFSDGMDTGWYCPECLAGARAVLKQRRVQRKAVDQMTQKAWETFRIKQQGKYWPE